MARKEQDLEDPSPPQAQDTIATAQAEDSIYDSISVEIEKNREYWLEKVNVHLEKLLEKENRDTTMQRNMARHYYAMNVIARLG